MNETELHIAELEARIAMLESTVNVLRDQVNSDLHPRITEMETRAIRRLEMVEEAVFSNPAPEPETVSKAEWDAAQEQIKYLVNTICEIHEALDTYVYTLPGGTSGGARLIAEMCKKAEDRQLEFEAEQGN
jgi:nicotinic acid mononucleotide adenylyltransferase